MPCHALVGVRNKALANSKGGFGIWFCICQKDPWAHNNFNYNYKRYKIKTIADSEFGRLSGLSKTSNFVPDKLVL